MRRVLLTHLLYIVLSIIFERTLKTVRRFKYLLCYVYTVSKKTRQVWQAVVSTNVD